MALAPTLEAHPLWPDMRRLIRVQPGRGTGQHYPSYRLEIALPLHLRPQLLRMEIACAVCGYPMHPIRERRGVTRTAFVAVSCDWSRSMSCSRSSKAHEAVARLAAAIGIRPTPKQSSLFEE